MSSLVWLKFHLKMSSMKVSLILLGILLVKPHTWQWSLVGLYLRNKFSMSVSEREHIPAAYFSGPGGAVWFDRYMRLSFVALPSFKHISKDIHTGKPHM
jgi:hypothetical protein